MNPSILPSLLLFSQIARHQSFTKAAAELGMSRAALSKNLKALEERLKMRLLNRTTRDMSLTDEGRRLLESLGPAFASIDRTLRSLEDADDHPSGLLRINSGHAAAKVLLEPHIAEFLTRYPNLQLELVIDDGLANIISDGCDAGIRLGESLAEHVVAVPITPMIEMVVAGSPAYFVNNAVPVTIEDLARHNCISYRSFGTGAIYHWEFSSHEVNNRPIRVEPNGSLITNSDESMISAALQGVGLIQHVSVSLQPYLDEGSLVRVLAQFCLPFPGFYLYVPTRQNMTPRVRALMDFLTEKREAMVQHEADQGP
ncbi:LysR family transcriptional regulator [Acidovorax sp. SUPP3434]|uniref:LysR family transcriptional regulator n=1 Tax=Acidovorax sp. SUPP3434 TaxID=2920880 RepID=UPI0023DE6686|nr:LysR family transcriptional regulator [Acidovorax sp. SUPP3434]GKT02293.1 LysR family transcriptional regulator [Acidovorax sp. SUPP3434]